MKSAANGFHWPLQGTTTQANVYTVSKDETEEQLQISFITYMNDQGGCGHSPVIPKPAAMTRIAENAEEPYRKDTKDGDVAQVEQSSRYDMTQLASAVVINEQGSLKTVKDLRTDRNSEGHSTENGESRNDDATADGHVNSEERTQDEQDVFPGIPQPSGAATSRKQQTPTHQSLHKGRAGPVQRNWGTQADLAGD